MSVRKMQPILRDAGRPLMRALSNFFPTTCDGGGVGRTIPWGKGRKCEEVGIVQSHVLLLAERMRSERPFVPFNKIRSTSTLVFVGDSTNRGMLYTLLEWVNGTLSTWDKTHDLRLVRGANGGDTTFAFAYYPRFWLPSNKRPAFDDTLNQLLQRRVVCVSGRPRSRQYAVKGRLSSR
ncbi:Cadherin-like and PC-esterase domain-containing protein 1 [Portunus trituberculatus]|uniref:Cadherin-like and PC-esterase domain-containing protein 1 n=1 Tax=Portunus trituberculatus TaxID=210409 RepID=A0A5B7DWY1_PORTR|nr:Cadherin-like and PC-esterase domain-containing protein 1 [Portunus trituberculatus]